MQCCSDCLGVGLPSLGDISLLMNTLEIDSIFLCGAPRPTLQEISGAVCLFPEMLQAWLQADKGFGPDICRLHVKPLKICCYPNRLSWPIGAEKNPTEWEKLISLQCLFNISEAKTYKEPIKNFFRKWYLNWLPAIDIMRPWAQCLRGLATHCPMQPRAFDLHNGLPWKEITQLISFQGSNRQAMRRVPLMWLELNGGLNSDGFYYTTTTNRGYLVTPDRTIEANKGHNGWHWTPASPLVQRRTPV